MSSSITVLLTEDHTILRDGLRSLLGAESDIQIVGEAENGRKAVELAQKLLPDVIVMDIGMPQMNGLEATRQIRQAVPDAKILILSAYTDDTYVQEVMKLGASGYLIKRTAGHVLPSAIREVAKGNTVFSPGLSHHARSSGNDKAAGDNSKIMNLTSREAEVLQLVAEGKANKEMAALLNISIKTVEKHRQSLMERLRIHDTAGLTRYAISKGIVENQI